MAAAEAANDVAAAPEHEHIAIDSTPTEIASTTNPEDLKLRATEYITQEKFNRNFTLPATEAHGDLNVTYAVGGEDSTNAPTLLFIGGMMGGRYLATNLDYIARKRGIRVVVTDRPGLGRSTPVKPSLRLPVWLETVPVLMRTINTRHVSLCAHSCGVIYALNTIYSMPWILPPSNRKLYLLAPWVRPEFSGMTYLSITSYLPSALFNGFDSIIRFVNSTVMPTVSFSGVVSNRVSAPFSKIGGEKPIDGGYRFRKHERDDLCREYDGVSAAESAARNKVLMRCVFDEDISGSNHEALLLLRKEVAGSWGPFDSYEDYPSKLEEKLQGYHQQRETEESQSAAAGGLVAPSAQHRFGLRVFWAEKDQLIGRKGREYFDKCFQRFTEDELSSRLSYESDVVPDTEHDTLCLPHYGVLSKILEDICNA